MLIGELEADAGAPEGDAWEGKPQGRIGFPSVRGVTAGAVALAVATAFTNWLLRAAAAASTMIEGFDGVIWALHGVTLLG